MPFPKITTEDLLRNSAQDILAILNQPLPAAPCLNISGDIRNAIQKIATILNRAVTPTQLPKVRTQQPTSPELNLVPLPRVQPTQLNDKSHPTSPNSANCQANANHIYNTITGAKETYDSLRQHNPKRWETSFANEIGRLSQGVGTRMPSGNNNIFFIKRSQVPHGKTITYANPVCDYRPTKDDLYRVRLTLGGDRLSCPHDVGAPAGSSLCRNSF